MLRTLLACCLPALAALVVVGCSDENRHVAVTGRVTDAGQPLEVARRDIGLGKVDVEFYSIRDGEVVGSPYPATVDDEGNFDVPGPEGEGIPPGTYRIAVRQWDPYPDLDRLEGRLSMENSPIEREITGDERIEVDVSEYE